MYLIMSKNDSFVLEVTYSYPDVQAKANEYEEEVELVRGEYIATAQPNNEVQRAGREHGEAMEEI